MPNPTEEKHTHPQIEQIRTDLQRAKQAGQLRTDHIREIVRDAISQIATEFRHGSGEIRAIARETLAVVVESLQGQGKEIRDELTASIEGIVEGISHSRREAISQSQSELNQLQSQIQQQENQLNTEIEETLTEIDSTSKTASTDIRDAVGSAIATLRESEEAALLQKRYAQLQAQLAIVKANLAARYGDRYDEMKHYLDDAKNWYENARANQTESSTLEHKQTEVERKMGEAGTAIARKEKQVKQILKDLLHSILEAAKDDKDTAK